MQNTALDIFQPELCLKKEIRFHPDLTFGEKMFLAEIQSIIAHHESKKYPYTLHSLSEMFSISRQTAKNWLKKLINMGFLESEIEQENLEPKRYLKNLKQI